MAIYFNFISTHITFHSGMSDIRNCCLPLQVVPIFLDVIRDMVCCSNRLFKHFPLLWYLYHLSQWYRLTVSGLARLVGSGQHCIKESLGLSSLVAFLSESRFTC